MTPQIRSCMFYPPPALWFFLAEEDTHAPARFSMYSLMPFLDVVITIEYQASLTINGLPPLRQLRNDGMIIRCNAEAISLPLPARIVISYLM